MLSKFFKNFDKKKFLLVSKLIFILVAIVLITNISGKTYTRYESEADISANANVAFFVVEQGLYENHIYIDGLVPSSQPKYYRFYVTNVKDEKRADVDLTYTIARKNGFVSLITIVINILYFVVFQLYNKGQTIGKELMKIKVISDTDELTMNQMIFRSFIANSILLDIITFMFMLSNSRMTYFTGIAIFGTIQYTITHIR